MSENDVKILKKAVIYLLSEFSFLYGDIYDNINKEIKEHLTGEDLFMFDDAEASEKFVDAFLEDLEEKWNLNSDDIVEEISALVPEEEDEEEENGQEEEEEEEEEGEEEEEENGQEEEEIEEKGKKEYGIDDDIPEEDW